MSNDVVRQVELSTLIGQQVRLFTRRTKIDGRLFYSDEAGTFEVRYLSQGQRAKVIFPQAKALAYDDGEVVL